MRISPCSLGETHDAKPPPPFLALDCQRTIGPFYRSRQRDKTRQRPLDITHTSLTWSREPLNASVLWPGPAIADRLRRRYTPIGAQNSNSWLGGF